MSDSTPHPFRRRTFASVSIARGPEFLLLSAMLLLILVGNRATAEVPINMQVTCSGDAKAQVAVRWGHPHYNENDFLSWKVPCNNTPQLPPKLTLNTKESQFEIQTEGGIQTGYVLQATIPGRGGDSVITITHAGNPVERLGPLAHGSVKRVAGPNKYGEQNFRVTMPPGITPMVQITMTGMSPTSAGKVALRWGHPNYNSKGYFPLWSEVVGPATLPIIGPGTVRTFQLTNTNSEFEIQTEGGVDTSYEISIKFDFGQGFGASPDIDIIHGDSKPKVSFSGPVTFKPTPGNVYGELDVGVVDPDFP